MNKKITTLVAAAVFAGTLASYAVPAKPGLRTITQPDGTTVVAELRGDEFSSFYVTEDGSIMQLDANGFLRYASVDATGTIQLTEQRVAADNDAVVAAYARRGMVNRQEMNAVPLDAAARAVAANISRANREDLPWTGLGLMNRQSFPVTGDIKSVVILVEYKDVSFTLNQPYDYFYNLLNQEGFNQYNGVGSAAQWFRENSCGQFNPTFDVYGPVKLSQNRAYYGAQSGTRHDSNPAAMITEAVAALDGTVDFSQYDLDGDGYIDNIFVFYAGQGQASYGGPDTVWPHSSTISNGPVVDGVRVGRYACSNEWEYNAPDGIGTFVHEFSHVMGLPDLYATQYTNARTPGKWSAMDQGPYNSGGVRPPYYTAYERNALGWIDLEILPSPANITLEPIQNNVAYVIPGHVTNEFFLLETRSKQGWDEGTPGAGMLIWQVNYDPSVFNSNVVNNDPDKQYVNIIEANYPSSGTSVSGEAGYCFPNGFRKRICPTTNPNLQPWVGPVIQHDINNIKYSNYKVTFTVDGGTAEVETPVATDATAISENGFTANWNSVEGARSYHVTVSAEYPSEAQNEFLPFGTATDTKVVIPEGWTFTGADNDVYTAGTTFFGDSKPSLKFNSSDIALISPVYDGEIESLNFFLRSVTPSTSTIFAIEGRDSENGAWRILDANANLDEIKLKGQFFNVNVADEHVRQIKFVLYGSGRAALDDVTVTIAPTYTKVIENLNRVDAGTETSLQIPVTIEGTGVYSYVVEAKDANGLFTPKSNRVMVDLTNFSGVEDITVDDPNAPVEYFNLQGMRVENPGTGVYIRRQGENVSKVIIK